jgi:type IV fimbrial biogenesis protein FimT
LKPNIGTSLCRFLHLVKLNHMRKISGFTLIEVLVALSIIAVLLSLAAPSFKSMIQSNNMTSTVNGFLADMRFARSEAIRRGGNVVMCRSDSPEAANPTCGSGSSAGWESGWIIFHDLSGNGNKISTEPLLRVQGPISVVNTITEGGAATKFTFTATGRLTSSGMTSILFGSPPVFASTAQRTVCVSIGGRARINGDGFTYPCT